MSPSNPRDTKPSRILRARRALFLSFVYLGTLVGVACGNPEPQVIARFPAVAGASTAGGSGSPDVAGGGTAGLEPDAGGEAGSAGTAGTPLVIPLQRGRVKVIGGKLVTDVGTPLRGMLLPVDTGFDLPNIEILHQMVTTSGLNAVHVYLENADFATAGVNHLAADALVALAAQAGVYVVIGYGTGVNLGAFDAPRLKAFWTYYAGRYATWSNVVYEIQNDPEPSACAKSISSGTLMMEQQMYALIRSKAPDTHILMFSTTNFVQPAVLSDAVTALGSTVDWTNASFAVGSSGKCVEAVNFPKLVDAAFASGVSLFVSQLPALDAWQPFIPALEQGGVGWLQFRWFGVKTETLAGFNKAVNAAPTVTWCPERGTFPQDSAACR